MSKKRSKVARDRLRLEFDRQWPAHGPGPIYRRSFAPFNPVQGEIVDAE